MEIGEIKLRNAQLCLKEVGLKQLEDVPILKVGGVELGGLKAALNIDSYGFMPSHFLALNEQMQLLQVLLFQVTILYRVWSVLCIWVTACWYSRKAYGALVSIEVQSLCSPKSNYQRRVKPISGLLPCPF